MRQGKVPGWHVAQAREGEEGSSKGVGEMSDAVNHPSHYTGGDIECIDAIKASMTNEAFLGYLKGNIQKYLWRYEKKVAPMEDLKKAKWYLERLIKEQAE